MEQSAKYSADEKNDIVVSKEWEPANSNEDAFIDEYLKLKEYGGPKSSNTYNKIQSPGKIITKIELILKEVMIKFEY